MRKSPLHIGIVVPTYNRAVLCLETLESVWAQTLPPQQVVVVDDGSTDDTRERLAPLAQAGRITYRYQENAHLSAARNTGLAALSPSIDAVLFLDSDDCLAPDALERLAQALLQSPHAPFAYGRPRLVWPEGEPTGGSWGIADFDGAGQWDSLIQRNFICTAGCVLLRRSALAAQPQPVWDTTLRSAEDWDLWLRLTENGAPIARVAPAQQPVLDYRTLPDSMSRQYDTMIAMELRTLEKHLSRARQSGNARREALVETLITERQARVQAARQSGVALGEALVAPRHRALRGLVARLGIGRLWRRVPLPARLWIRERLGISRWS